MPFNKLPRLRDPQQRDFVHQVKDLALERYKLEPELYYEEDIRQVEEVQFILQRCIISKRKNIEDSVNMLDSMLKWRKQQRLRELSDQDFPQEFFICGAAFLYEPDKYGNRTLYIRTSMLKTTPELKVALKEFIAYLMYQIDDGVNGESWSVILDLTNTGWNNYDIDLIMHFLTLLKEYFPVNVDYVLCVNFPWILSTAWTVVKRLIPAERRDVVVFISDKEILNFVERDNLPDFLGGDCKREYLLRPKGCPTVLEHLLSQKEPELSIKKIREIIKSFTDVLPKTHVANLLTQLDQCSRD